ncbi:hypothetical protein [Paraprevotella xylaniphila]|jgi:hypothetical protein|uniref:hypothetical protein n=1 Tax=Paraprevotella xylaniphila TaxID=454155 RepID=UPI001032F8DA|nr:hypothetical protein [Paraprevotella xylaniphila]
MKFSKAAVPLCAIVAASVTFMVGCNDDSDFFDEPAGLDVNQTVPLFKRNSQFDITTGNQLPPSTFDVPKEEDECMLNAILQIAVDKKKKVFGRTIGRDAQGNIYTAAQAYAEVKKFAMEYKKVDGNGNVDANYQPYTGGAMKPSLAAEIGRQSGILKGEILSFDSYEEMQAHVSTSEWKKAHPGGTYIINSNSEQHASICTGVNKNGIISIKSAENGRSKMNPDKYDYTGFSIIY